MKKLTLLILFITLGGIIWFFQSSSFSTIKREAEITYESNDKYDYQKEARNYVRYLSENEKLNALKTTTAKPISTKEAIIPVVNNSFKFIAIGDSERYKGGTGFSKNILATVTKAKEYNPDFVIFTGDIITAGDKDRNEDKRRIKNIKNVLDELLPETKYYFAFGHHDIECGNQCVDFWLKTFFNKKVKSQADRKLYHSFDYKNTHIVLLSTDYPLERSIDQAQLNWLDKDLASTQKPNKIVVSHVPPITFFKESAKDCHDMSCAGNPRDQLLNTLQKHQVDLVISGHENAFDHKTHNGIDYVLSGNATGSEPRYKEALKGKSFIYFEVNQEKIIMKALELDGDVIREIEIK